MQELMSRHKAYALSPRDCLKTTLFQKWQRIIAPPGKRGRRTVALHEKHQPVRSNGHRVDNGNRFLLSRNDASVVVAFLRVATLGSTGFSLTTGNRPIFPLRIPPDDDASTRSCWRSLAFLRNGRSWARLKSQRDRTTLPNLDNCYPRLIDRSGAC